MLAFASLVVLWSLPTAFLYTEFNNDNDNEEDATLTVPQLIVKYKYPVEIHQVTTGDGYVLTMHRIPYGQSQDSSKTRKVVFLQHGLLGSSADFVLTGPEFALAYTLADARYDVWMGNARGNRYSRNHTKLTPNDSAYWKFSWHEIAIHDLPSMIDFVLSHTKQEDLFHIGHSQGTTTFYAMISKKPSYNDKIIAHFSLAPMAYMRHSHSPMLRHIARGSRLIKILEESIGRDEFLPNKYFVSLAGISFCADKGITQILCTNPLFVLCGFNVNQINKTMVPVIMGHVPAGGSTKLVVHYGQEVLSASFDQWNYGVGLSNNEKYGRTRPPHYKVRRITKPVYLIHSNNDWLSNEVDVKTLILQLRTLKAEYLVPDYTWSNLDYVYGKDAKQLVYSKLLNWMKKY